MLQRMLNSDPFPVPFPGPDTVNLSPPSEADSILIAAGILSATRTADGNTEFQGLLAEAITEAMTGHRVDALALPYFDAETNARNMTNRSEGYRMRMVHMMLLSALVLKPIPPAVAAQVGEYSRWLGIDDRLLRTVEEFATSDHALAASDFERNGYTADWSKERCQVLHTGRKVMHGWDVDDDDPPLAARWQALGLLPDDTLGRQVYNFYQARGFAFPGLPGSAPPLLAQHDWVHVLADYGTKVEAELEVFAFIARANDDPRGFSLLAMVVSLFETGYLSSDAGLFEAFPGQLSMRGMTVRIADAMRRGALSHGLQGRADVDFMTLDWFALADQSVESLREQFKIVPKSAGAIAAGSVTPWEPGGISIAQLGMGQQLAEREGRTHDTFGASVIDGV
jgi:hypothetical protein